MVRLHSAVTESEVTPYQPSQSEDGTLLTFECMGLPAVESQELSSPDPWADPAQANRSGRQILKSAIKYCEWMADRGNDGHITPESRWCLNRRWYLNAMYALQVVIDSPERVGIAPALPVLNPAPARDPRAADYEKKLVKELVPLLMAANPRLTSKRILSHFSRAKLANMLCDALREHSAAERA